MANKYVNKLIVGTDVKLDLSGDTIVASDLKKGVTAHDKSGAPIVGSNEFDVNSQDATAAVAEVLKDKTFYARGSKLTGTMPDNGGQTLDIADKDEEPAIPMGFHDGSGKSRIKPTEKAKLMLDGAESRWWTRSPSINGTTNFIFVSSAGTKGTIRGGAALGVPFCFCF